MKHISSPQVSPYSLSFGPMKHRPLRPECAHPHPGALPLPPGQGAHLCVHHHCRLPPSVWGQSKLSPVSRPPVCAGLRGGGTQGASDGQCGAQGSCPVPGCSSATVGCGREEETDAPTAHRYMAGVTGKARLTVETWVWLW